MVLVVSASQAQAAAIPLAWDPPTEKEVGIAAYRKDNYDWAKRLLNEAAPKMPDDADVQFYLGMCRLKLNDQAGAREALTKALELAPDSPNAAAARQALSTIVP